jgi:SNF2-related domain
VITCTAAHVCTQLGHWQHQLEKHAEPAYLGSVLYDNCTTNGSLPPAEQLAEYDIVVTTTARLAQEERKRFDTVRAVGHVNADDYARGTVGGNRKFRQAIAKAKADRYVSPC